jgi:hypothetical protein
MPLGVALGDGGLPLERLPRPFVRGGLGKVAGDGWGVSRKASVTRISQSSSERGINEAMRDSWMSASMYPSESCRIGTSWDRVTQSNGESGKDRPRSRWRSSDCSRWSAAVGAAGEGNGDVQILHCRSLMI